MDNKRSYTVCKHWMMPSCPNRSNESMLKTEPKQPPVDYLTSHDIEIINKLCAVCPKFEKTTNK